MQTLVRRFASRLRFPQLFFVTAALFVFDLFFPDLIPAVDELLLGLLTLLFGLWRDRRGIPGEEPPAPPMKDVTPRDGGRDG